MMRETSRSVRRKQPRRGLRSTKSLFQLHPDWRTDMARPTTYRAERTGLLLVDPYNDFLSEGGKLFPMLKDIANDVPLLDNLRTTGATVRKAGIHLFAAPPPPSHTPHYH